eukprot:scaffold26255_cov59-Phaeocystis_antarctica.AAC.3
MWAAWATARPRGARRAELYTISITRAAGVSRSRTVRVPHFAWCPGVYTELYPPHTPPRPVSPGWGCAFDHTERNNNYYSCMPWISTN